MLRESPWFAIGDPVKRQRRRLNSSTDQPVVGVDGFRSESGIDDGDRMIKEESRRETASVDFECHICFESAVDPVVTSCGHLFFWPCLYKWLRLYSNPEECPTCKGHVTESNAIPIYRRGSSPELKNAGKNPCLGGGDLKIPPKPHGHRMETTRIRDSRRRIRPGLYYLVTKSQDRLDSS